MGQKIIVASKLPMHLELQLCVSREQRVVQGANSWTENVYFKDGPTVVIRGTSYPNGTAPEGFPQRGLMVDGAVLTHGVDKDFFDAWMEQNKNSHMVKNGLIFAATKGNDISAKAREHRDVDSGLGPLRPDNDRRMPKKIIARGNGGVPQPTAADIDSYAATPAIGVDA